MPIVIPAIDVSEGKVVRLTKGDFSQKTVYSENTLEVVKFFYHKGVDRLHIVDLDAARTSSSTCLDLVKEIKVNYPDLQIQFGGGIRSLDIASFAVEAGADYIVIGSLFFTKPEEFLKISMNFREKIILSLDIDVDKIVIHGWQEDVKDVRFEDVIDRVVKIGIPRIISTDVTRDGTLLGPDLTFISNLLGTLRKSYFSYIVDRIIEYEEIQPFINTMSETIVKNVENFFSVLKDPVRSEYDIRKAIETYDQEFDDVKLNLKNKLNLVLNKILKKYPKPYMILSGGVSSDNDVEEIFKLDNGFLEGVIVGKSIYEGKISMFSSQ